MEGIRPNWSSRSDWSPGLTADPLITGVPVYDCAAGPILSSPLRTAASHGDTSLGPSNRTGRQRHGWRSEAHAVEALHQVGAPFVGRADSATSASKSSSPPRARERGRILSRSRTTWSYAPLSAGWSAASRCLQYTARASAGCCSPRAAAKPGAHITATGHPCRVLRPRTRTPIAAPVCVNVPRADDSRNLTTPTHEQACDCTAWLTDAPCRCGRMSLARLVTSV